MASESPRRNSLPGILSLTGPKVLWAALILMVGGAAQAALPPVVEGNPPTAPAGAASNVGLVEIYNRLQQLQNEVQTLRGQVEEQTYLIDNMTKRQRDLYMDLDRRIQQLESGQASQGPASSDLGGPSEPSGSSAGSPAPASGNDQAAYDQAFDLLKSGKYEQAATAFQQFVAQYPNSGYLPNALYWQGEAYYVTRKFDPAMSAFQQVLRDHATHSKAKDALLKVGYIQFENKDWAASRQTLRDVVSKYPGTSAARLAQQRLNTIPK